MYAPRQILGEAKSGKIGAFRKTPEVLMFGRRHVLAGERFIQMVLRFLQRPYRDFQIAPTLDV
jgi:hypothetical protein